MKRRHEVKQRPIGSSVITRPHPGGLGDCGPGNEARTVLPLFDGQRLRLAREHLGVTQRGLADAMAGRLTPAALSQFEKGDAKPSPGTLAELAAATGLPVRFFARDPAVDDVGSVEGFFRSLRSTGVRHRRQHRAQAELVRLVTMALERYVKLPKHDVPRIPMRPGSSRTEVEAAAAQVRAEWNLPKGPVTHVIRCIERHGVVVCRMLLQSGTVDAFSVPFTDRPVIVLGRDKDRADRSRWDCSHELGHLVMHQPDPVRSRYLEDQANWFAAEFLLPFREVAGQLRNARRRLRASVEDHVHTRMESPGTYPARTGGDAGDARPRDPTAQPVRDLGWPARQ